MNINHENHKKLWGWLAETGSQYKSDWPGWGNINIVENDCFACEEDNYLDPDGAGFCDNCPIDFGAGYGKCCASKSLYQQWDDCTDIEIRKQLADTIRDLPWRGDE